MYQVPNFLIFILFNANAFTQSWQIEMKFLAWFIIIYFFSFAQRCTEVGVAQLGLKYLLVAQVKYPLAIS